MRVGTIRVLASGLAVIAVLATTGALVTGLHHRLYGAARYPIIAMRATRSATSVQDAVVRLHEFTYQTLRLPRAAAVSRYAASDTLMREFEYCDPVAYCVPIDSVFIRLLREIGVVGSLVTDEDLRAALSSVSQDHPAYRTPAVHLALDRSEPGPVGLLRSALRVTVRSLPDALIDGLQDLYLLSHPERRGSDGVASSGDGSLFFRARNYQVFLRIAAAEATYQELLQRYPDSPYADHGLYHLGLLQLAHSNDPRAARATLRRLLERYPGTSFATDAEHLYRIARGREAERRSAVAEQAGSSTCDFTYAESFHAGARGWMTYLPSGRVHAVHWQEDFPSRWPRPEDHLFSGGYVFSRSPWWIDPNHRPPGGAGFLHLVAFLFSDGRHGGPKLPTLDLRDGTMSSRLRGQSVVFRGSHLVFWIQARDGESGRFVNYALTGHPLDRALEDGEWSDVRVDLPDDASQWTCLGSADSRRDMYGCSPLAAILGNIDDSADFGFLLFPIDPKAPPTGVIDFDSFALRGKTTCQSVGAAGSRTASKTAPGP